MTTSYRMIDLFAGCGGLSSGFQSASTQEIEFRPVAAVELDASAAATYAANQGDHVFHGDIKDWLAGDLPEAEIVLGGPPCQGFSSLGNRDPNDPRNGLWEAYVEAVRRVRPLFFVLENVPQFLKSEEFAQLGRAVDSGGPLEDYFLESYTLNAVDYGTPQSRRRAIVIGRLKPLPAIGSPEPTTHLNKLVVRDAFKGLRRHVKQVDLPNRSRKFRDRDVPGPFKSSELHLSRRFERITLERFEHIPLGGSRFDIPEHLLPRCWKNHRSGSVDVMGRLHWDKPSVTIRTEFFKPEKGRYVHPNQDRSITHLEATRIQGFPDDFLWHGSKTAIARQIGNAVPIPLAAAIAGHLRVSGLEPLLASGTEISK